MRIRNRWKTISPSLQSFSGGRAAVTWQGFAINRNETDLSLCQSKRSRQISRNLQWSDFLWCRIKLQDENIKLALEMCEFYWFNFEIFRFENPRKICSPMRFIEYHRLPIRSSFSGDLIVSGVLWNFRILVTLHWNIMQMGNGKIRHMKVIWFRKLLFWGTSVLRGIAAHPVEKGALRWYCRNQHL
jgi:hypothetical protein